jgi:hypothetical protein
MTGGAPTGTGSTIFALGEDGVVTLHADLAAVRTQCEGIDVESGVWDFFDAAGKPLEPRFIVPNRVSKVLGKIVAASSGVFELVPARDASEPALLECLADGVLLRSNPRFASIEDLRAYLIAARASEAGDPR